MQAISVVDESLLRNFAPVDVSIDLGGLPSRIKANNIQLESSCGDADAFSFGNACASTVSMTIDGAYPDIQGERLILKWNVRYTQSYPLFWGTITNAEISAGKTTIRAGDVMATKGGEPMMISDRMRDHMTAGEGWIAVAAQLDCFYSQDDVDRLDPIGIVNGFSSLPDEVSISAVAGYLAGLVGCNAVIDRSGWLRLTGPSAAASGGTTFQSYAGGSSAQDHTFIVSGITMERRELVTVRAEDGSVSEEEQISVFSAGDGTLLVENPLADQTTADLAWDNLKDLSFLPGKYSFPQGIQVEPGDQIRVQTLEGYQPIVAMSVTHAIDGGVKTTASCGGWPDNGGTPGQINQALKTLSAEFARVRKLIAENAEIVNARIDNLRAEDIIAGRIRSEDFSVTEMPFIYPMVDKYPSSTLYPSDGEQIIKGFEIDFSSQIIRGSFASDVTDALDRRITAVEEILASLGY